MKHYKNIFNILTIAFVLIFLGTMFAYAKGPAVLRFKIYQMPEPKSDISTVVVKKEWKSLKAETKAYDPTGKIDPFDDSFMYVVVEKTVTPAPEPEPVSVPDTTLTRWTLEQLRLEGTVISDKHIFAAFKTPAGAKCFKAEVGDYLGKDGFVITSIINGLVEAKLDDSVYQYKTFQ